MLPVVTIVGRPNVGKSTLFNCLTQTRHALVADIAGVTRDRHYGEAKHENRKFIVIDTGGLEDEESGVIAHMSAQAKLSIDEADLVLFVVDARDGITPNDEKIASHLRKQGKKIFPVVNKTDGLQEEIALSDFYGLGFNEPIAVAAAHQRGINALKDLIVSHLPDELPEEISEKQDAIHIAIIGRPNVGKSTLVNKILGEERVIAFDEPGTTRDSIFVPFKKGKQEYVLIDTAGVRRRGRLREILEKFSVVKSLKAIKACNVVVLIVDAKENIADQDLKLLKFVMDSGKALVIAVNKWDGVDADEKAWVERELDRRLNFVKFADLHFISALKGTGVNRVLRSVNKAYQSATRELTSSQLTRILEKAVTKHPPPMVRGRRIKLRFAHPAGYNPPVVVLHGNQTRSVPIDYQRYLMNCFSEALGLVGTPIKLEFKTTENPYKDKKNKLTERQQHKRRRLLRHVKKRK